MTKKQALKRALEDLPIVAQSAVLKEEKGYSVVLTEECVQYQLEKNPDAVIKIFNSLDYLVPKPKVITAENYKQFKPSEFIRSFKSDIDRARKLGKPMNMDQWETKQRSPCLPCLGGMACMNLGIQMPAMWSNLPLTENVSRVGDAIRLGDTVHVIYKVRRLYGNNRITARFLKPSSSYPEIDGLVGTPAQFRHLKERVDIFADAFEAAGY